MQQTVQIVEQTIQEVAAFYESGLAARRHFLSEDDCKCFLYAALHKNLFGDWQTAVSSPIALHTEISFFDENYISRFRPDMTLLRRDGMTFDDGRFQWHFSENAAIAAIEIKFIKAPAQAKMVEAIAHDCQKLTDLQQSNPNLHGFMLCFSHAGELKNELIALSRQFPQIQLIFIG